jgi:hypothetical protein
MTPEGIVKKQVKAFLKTIKAYFFMPMQNGFGVVGVPDLICCVKGKFLGIETKAPGKRSTVTANQQVQIDAIHAAGGYAVVVTSVEELIAYMRENGLLD